MLFIEEYYKLNIKNIHYKMLKENKKFYKKETILILLFFSLFGLIIWFAKSPVIRFGISYLYVLFFITNAAVEGLTMTDDTRNLIGEFIDPLEGCCPHASVVKKLTDAAVEKEKKLKAEEQKVVYFQWHFVHHKLKLPLHVVQHFHLKIQSQKFVKIKSQKY